MEDNNSPMPLAFTLNNGTQIPSIGFGTWKLENVYQNTKSAIQMGYRMIDTASLYKNEEEIGIAIQECINEGIIQRKDLYIVTKVWNDDQEDPITSLRDSLKRLSLDYVDLFLVHWPIGRCVPGEKLKKVPLHILWKNMEECVSLNLTKSIGVSNFNVQLLLDLLSYATIPPVVNQVELHPLLSQQDLVNFCSLHEVCMMAFNPTGRGSSAQKKRDLLEKYDLIKNEEIIKLSQKYSQQPMQIILNWHINRKVVPLPMSKNVDHQLENLKSLNFKMEAEDYVIVDKLDIGLRYCTSKDKPFSLGIELFA